MSKNEAAAMKAMPPASSVGVGRSHRMGALAFIFVALMMVVPRRPDVRLYYARTASDHLGTALTLGTLGLAAFAIARSLPVWRWFAWLRFAPRWLRDPPYDLIARNRYRWFGMKKACTKALMIQVVAKKIKNSCFPQPVVAPIEFTWAKTIK